MNTMVKNLLLVLTFTFLIPNFYIKNASANNNTKENRGKIKKVSSSFIKKINKHCKIQKIIYDDGSSIEMLQIIGPPQPPEGYITQRSAASFPEPSLAMGDKILNVPAYNWVFGCSAVSAAMIAAYHDRTGYENIYTGPTNKGIMPLNNSSWPTWSDGYATYPNLPLAASRNGVDGRTTRGSIDDYWISYGNYSNDPYITKGWPEHIYGSAIGDYMGTSQSVYGNSDGGTWFIVPPDSGPFNCSEGEGDGFYQSTGTYGRKLFYEKRGYIVSECYDQNTDNNGGGFTFADYKRQIDAGNPVLLNVEGHSMVGVGYNDTGNVVYLHDTWDYSTHTMTWGGSYVGMRLLSVSIVNLASKDSINGMISAINTLLLNEQKIITPPDPFTPPEPCALVPNGTFELGKVNWNESSSSWQSIISNTLGINAHSGSWGAKFGGINSEIAFIGQNITVPISCSTLSFYNWISSYESFSGWDYGYVLIDGESVATYPLFIETNTNGWVKTTIDLQRFSGKTVILEFLATFDSSVNSTWYIDDISFE